MSDLRKRLEEAAEWSGKRLKKAHEKARELGEKAAQQAEELFSDADSGELATRLQGEADRLATRLEEAAQRFFEPAELGHQVFTELQEREVIAEDWPAEQAANIAEKLNGVRDKEPLTPVVVKSTEINVCTVPGRNIYISQQLQERLCPDAIAFVLAHEMAHHDVGHLARVASVVNRLPAWLPATPTATLAATLAIRPEMELEADRYALSLCLEAGFEREAALSALNVIEHYLIDQKGANGIFGLDPEWPLVEELEIWLNERRAGHPSIRVRKEALWNKEPSDGDEQAE
ncbi:MAG: M48 family metalloprotease [Proteobacteria bacterium]|jgi:Zn-dependent protease with chaperone function|nr:M48 family metalloprotease [Pseudomonadota bacterium]